MAEHDPIKSIQTAIEPLRDKITNHPLYASIKNIDDLRVFMKYHVYAVWDFMSLLKALQANLTCTSAPWFPIGNGDTRYLINEIVTGEESDIDFEGIRKSHFEMYLDAMRQCHADTKEIETFIDSIKATGDLDESFDQAKSPTQIRKFVSFTFDVIKTDKPHLQASAFTFGREDLIPGMFISMVSDINQNFPNELKFFKYYLERHIEMDGDQHGHLASQMLRNLCGDNLKKWQEAESVAIDSLEQRIKLWDAALNEILFGDYLSN